VPNFSLRLIIEIIIIIIPIIVNGNIYQKILLFVKNSNIIENTPMITNNRPVYNALR
jgi:hypothetical protein